mgnify:CR=1 FL=1
MKDSETQELCDIANSCRHWRPACGKREIQLSNYYSVRNFLQKEISLKKLTNEALTRSNILTISNLCRKLCKENGIPVYKAHSSKTKFRPKTVSLYPYSILQMAVYETE